MAFGFPAYAVAVEHYDADRDELLEAIDEALDELNWNAQQTGPSSLRANIGTNFLSWGERVTIEVRDGKVRVRSQCVFPTQCFDWGKNQKNVDEFFDELDRAVRRRRGRRARRGEEPSDEQRVKPAGGVRRTSPDRPPAPPKAPPADARTRPRDDADR